MNSLRPTHSVKNPNAAICYEAALNHEGPNRFSLKFKDPFPYTRDSRIAGIFEMHKNCLCEECGEYVQFPVKIDNTIQSVWLNKDSLAMNLGVDPDYIVQNCLPSRIAKAAAVKSIMNRVPQRIADLHFSKKDFLLLLESSIYSIGGEIFSKVKGNKREGSGACVKQALDLSTNRVIARRITRITDLNKDSATKAYGIMCRFRNQPGILKLLGKVLYQNRDGHIKFVTFHPYYDKDLFTALFEEKWRHKKEDCMGYIDQIVNALCSLNGAHCDLNPENLLLKYKEIVLADLEFYQPYDDKTRITRGTWKWMAPEVLNRNSTDTSKVDVWALGLIILYMLSATARRQICNWQQVEKRELIAHYLNNTSQDSINKWIRNSGIDAPVQELLLHMIVIDPKDRFTIQQVQKAFAELK